MILGFIVLWLLRKKLSKQFIFISSWLLATLFAITLSERPYPHYFVQSLAPASMLIGMLLMLKNIEQALVVAPLTFAFFVPFYFKFWYYPTYPYYLKFANFALRKIEKTSYFDSFSKYTNTNYEIADFLAKASKKEDKVFVWSNDSATIYSLSRRLPPTKYVADYHFKDFATEESTIEILQKNMPKFIVIILLYIFFLMQNRYVVWQCIVPNINCLICIPRYLNTPLYIRPCYRNIFKTSFDKPNYIVIPFLRSYKILVFFQIL
jgi:hypothetical protein